MNSKLISIVVPMYFEEEVVHECYKRLTRVAEENNLNYELVFVNDGSTDKTLEILENIAQEDMHVKIISLSRNFGHQIAVSAGLDKTQGDAVVIIDADLQDPPEIIPEMISLWEKGYDVVYGKRKKREGESYFKLITAKAFYRFLDRMSNVKIPMDTGDFRLMDRKVIEALKKMPEHNRFLRGMSSWVGFKQIPLEYERKERFAGETKYPFKKMIKLALDGIFSFSAKPLKIVEYAGISTIALAVLTLIFIVTMELMGANMFSLGWSIGLAILVFLSGVQLLSIGVIGEYISRIYDESTGRPLYIVDKEINIEKEIIKPIYGTDNRVGLDRSFQRSLYLISKKINLDKKYDVK